MKALLPVIALALFAASLPAKAQDRVHKQRGITPEAVGDPMKRLYRISGVRDNGGGPNTGVATSFHCSSFSTVNETVQFNMRNYLGVNTTRNLLIRPFETRTASTHATVLFSEDLLLTPGTILDQGSANILATSTNIFCSAMTVDASSLTAQGFSLHMVRYNPVANTTE